MFWRTVLTSASLLLTAASAFQQSYLDSISKAGNVGGGGSSPNPQNSNVPLEGPAYAPAGQLNDPSSNNAFHGGTSSPSSVYASNGSTKDPIDLTGESSTSNNELGQATPEDDQLPPGWFEYLDDASGMPYYYDVESGVTTWDRPGTLLQDNNVEETVNDKEDLYTEYMKQVEDVQQSQQQQQVSQQNLDSKEESGGTSSWSGSTSSWNAPQQTSSAAATSTEKSSSGVSNQYLEYMNQRNQQNSAASPSVEKQVRTIEKTNIGIEDVLPYGNKASFEVDDESTEESPMTSFPSSLDALIERQMKGSATSSEEYVENLKLEYQSKLKKQLRLAITGGVPLNREMKGERLAPELDTRGMTERIMKSIRTENQAMGAGGDSTWQAFQQAEANWARLREYMPNPKDLPPTPFVTEEGGKGNPRCFAKLHHQRARTLDFDIAICGGTLGIFFATALQLKGNKVCVVEAGKLQGREQEWNISMDELLQLKQMGVISQEDIDAAVQTEFPGCRSGFKNKEVPLEDGYLDNGVGYECYTEGVLNVGVSPKILLDRVAERFKSLGGVIQEETKLEGVCVIKDIGASLDFGKEKEPVTAALIIDAMGNNSPITRQQRFGLKPDGVCTVVGTCASGFDPKTNTLGDIIYTNTPIQDKGRNGGKMQYFWEAFPVNIGRNGKEPGTSSTKTTYMFTYMDADQKRPTLETLLEDYWRLLPQYQASISNPETDLDVHRVLFAFFPTYKDSPLEPGFHRVLAVGDASGIQSPLSFGGFGALTRHLERVSNAVTDALDSNLLTKHDLAEINTYTPNLSASWMFQKAMSVRMGQPFVDKRFVNRLLATNFQAMNAMGPATIKPFLQDVVRFDGLVGSLTRSFLSDPTFLPQILLWVGLPTAVEWAAHVGMMGTYAALDNFVAPWLGPVGNATIRKNRSRFQLNRKLDAWKYGSGNDYDVKKIPKK